VSYRVEFSSDAATYFHHMPRPGQDAFYARAAELADAPWDGVQIALPGTSSGLRSAAFGEHGIVYFSVEDATNTITFFELVWAD
jgi:hypothetical protein